MAPKNASRSTGIILQGCYIMATSSPANPLSGSYERLSWGTELLLLFSGSRQKERIEHWREHAQTWREMIDENRTDRIRFLSGHLDILDRKFGTLLQFQGLLPVAIATLLSGMRVVPNSNFRLILGAFGVSWLVNTLFCLLGVRRLEWGDLWLYRGDRGQAEDNHINRLIRAIVLRTSEFRIAAAITLLEILLIAALVAVAISLLRRV